MPVGAMTPMSYTRRDERVWDSLSATAALLFGAMLIAAVLTNPPEVAGAEADAPIAFAEQSAVTLSTNAVPVQLVNNTASEWTLSVMAYLDVADDVVSSRTVDATAPATISEGGSVIVEVGPSPADVTTGTGFVVVTASRAGETVVARRALLVTAVSEPQIEKWSGSNQLFTVSGAARGLPDLPLTGPGCGSLKDSSRDAFLTAGSDVGVLTYRCVPGSVNPEADARLVFDDGGIRSVGQYSGTLKLGEKTVALSYLNSAPISWALIAASVGLALGVLRQVRTNSLPVRRLDKRVTLIGEEALRNDDEYAKRAGAATYNGYDLMSAVGPEMARLQIALALLNPGWLTRQGWIAAFSGKDEEHLDGLVKEAAELNDLVQQWPNLATDFEELMAELRKVDELSLKGLAPNLVQSARSMVAPTEGNPKSTVLTIKQARDLVEAVPKTTRALRLLPVASQLSKELAHQPDVPSDRPVWVEAGHLTRQALAELAVAKDASSLEQAKVDELLTRARALYRQLPPREAGRTAAIVPQDFVPETVIALIAGLGRAARSTWSVLSARQIDIVWLAVAIGLAIWSGLTLYYVDKPWGRLGDIIIMVVWAFGATALLTPVLSAIEDVIGKPTTLKRKSDEEPK